MKLSLLILLLGFLTSCGQYKQSGSKLIKDSLLVDSIYSEGTWNHYFQDKKTPNGVFTRLKLISDSTYILQWGDSLRLETFPDTFYINGYENGIPRFADENEKYIVFRSGCGSPCWMGYFLPLDTSIKPISLHEYLGYDLENDLVASVEDSNIVQILNIKTGEKENHKINGCTSAFLGYCIDSLTITNRILRYKQIPGSKMNTDDGLIIEKIEI